MFDAIGHLRRGGKGLVRHSQPLLRPVHESHHSQYIVGKTRRSPCRWSHTGRCDGQPQTVLARFLFTHVFHYARCFIYTRTTGVVGGFYTPAISGGVMGLVSCGDLPLWYMDGARRGLPGGRRLSALFAPPPAPCSQVVLSKAHGPLGRTNPNPKVRKSGAVGTHFEVRGRIAECRACASCPCSRC